MLHFSARAFFECGRLLEAIRADCLVAAAVCVEGEPMFALVNDLDDLTKQKTIPCLESIEREFRKINLRITADTVADVLKDISRPRRSFQWLHDQSKNIERLAHKELEGKMFLYVPVEQSKFWPTNKEPHPFGNAVANAFPSAGFDIHNAAICMATSLSTAAVFHLMRVLEIALTVLGGKFGLSLVHTNWEQWINGVEAKIRDMHNDAAWKSLPDWKDQREFYSQAASHFAFFKDAWRNYTMHSRGKYEQDEAARIFENVKGLMQKLSERLSE